MQKKEYDRLYHAEERLWWFRALHLFLLRLLPRSQPGLRALDLGCGTGGFLTKLTAAGYRSVGMDISATALQHAASRGHATLVQASANAIPFAPAFDLVVCVDVLEVATVDPAKLVSNALRVLKPGGYGLFVMAAHQWLLSEHDRAVNSVRRYNLSQLKSLFTSPSAKILRASYLFLFVFPLLALRKLLNPKRAGAGEASSDISVPSPLINEPLFALCWLEAQLLRLVNLPMGSSVVVLVRKDG